ncbi:MAG: glycosyltransferase [Candidatus Omnitrophota bacterium]
MDKPSVSIVVAAKNAEKTIEKCITSILSLRYNNYEVIVIDDGSTDKTPNLLEKYKPRVTVITNVSSLGPSRSRNNAAKKGNGECIAFTDADCIVSDDWLNELVGCFDIYPEAVSCGGSQDIPPDATDFERRVFKFFKKSGIVTDYMRLKRFDKIIEVDHNPSCTVIYKREIFLEEGGFAEGLWPGEDVELDHRLRKKGYRIFFNPRAVVYHYRPKNIRSFIYMMYRYGWAQGVLVRKYGFFRKIHFIPVFSLICLMVFGILFFSQPYLLLLFVVICLAAVSGYFMFKLNMLILGVSGLIFWNIGFLKGLLYKKVSIIYP